MKRQRVGLKIVVGWMRDIKKASVGRNLLYVADRKILFYLIEGERFTVSSFEKQDLPKEEAGLDRTDRKSVV